jgi:G3E family GTPase
MTTDRLGRTPVVIITGFLGSGKTTLLNHLLSSTRFGRVAALVNDFGAINIDAALVAPVADEVVQLTNGCVCCTINGNLLAAAERILELDPPVDLIVVETTGLADPLPVGLTFLQTELRSRTSLDAVITVVDCANFALDIFSSDAAMAQVVHGDMIILNKTDLAHDGEVDSLRRRIAIMKPRARMLRAQYGRVPFEALLDPRDHGRRWDADDAGADEHRAHVLDDGFRAEAFRFTEPLSAERFQAWLDGGLPDGVFRAKGLVQFDRPDGRFVFQLCGSRAAFEPYDDQPGGSELVFIGHELDAALIAQGLEACEVRAPDGGGPPLAP